MAARKETNKTGTEVQRIRSGAFKAVKEPSASAKGVAASALSQRTDLVRLSAKQWTYEDVRAGIVSSRVRDLEKTGIIGRDDVRMIIPERTLERRIKAKEALRTEEADGIARLVRVVRHARDVFENDETANRWLRLPNPALGGEIPMRMAATDVGAREVETILARIEHGIFS